jgi:hypothetical protein
VRVFCVRVRLNFVYAAGGHEDFRSVRREAASTEAYTGLKYATDEILPPQSIPGTQPIMAGVYGTAPRNPQLDVEPAQHHYSAAQQPTVPRQHYENMAMR